MNVRDCKQIHANLVEAMHNDYNGAPRPNGPDDAYAWTRLLCRQLRPLTVKRLNDVKGVGPHDWL